MTNLFFNYYIDQSPARQAEIDECFHRNISNNQIDRVFVVVDFNTILVDRKMEKIFVIVHNERPTHKFFYSLVNHVCGDDDINIISNTDIFFHDLSLVESHLGKNDCFALSRWDLHRNDRAVLFDRGDSQDSWMFRGKIRDVPDCDFFLGRAGTDNAIAERLQRAGYNITNPSRSIYSYHLHESNIRRYNPKDVCPKPYLLVKPTEI
jgi:hypothetical protein